MLEGENLIYFGPEKWDGMWRNRHQLMSRFARCNKVLYVEPVVGFKQFRNRIFVNEFSKKIWPSTLMKGRVTKNKDNLYIYHSSRCIPILGRYLLNKITLAIWISLLKKTISKLEFNRPIIWLSRPTMDVYLNVFNEKLSIYHVVDEYLSYGNITEGERKKIGKIENKLINNVDMVIVVSKSLYNSKKKHSKSISVVNNGVDFEAYDNVMHEKQLPPEDIRSIKKPILGYSGLISNRLDLDLIQNMAIKCPECSIVMMGKVDTTDCEKYIESLANKRNVFFIGSKNVDIVPNYLKAFDVCLMPYCINEQTKNLDALKLYDYMATGKPVVSTNISPVKPFQELIYIARSKKTFIDCIGQALTEKNLDLPNKRRKLASCNTWDHRVFQLSDLIEAQISKKKLYPNDLKNK
jgi:glycosyltransferase involved in cell wall biosynthesis